MLYGEVLVTLNIRNTPNTDNPRVGQLFPGDLVQASIDLNGWWKLEKITRKADGKIETPINNVIWYAYTGMSNGYIKQLSAPQPQPEPTPAPTKSPLTVTIEGPGYKTVTVTVDPE